MEIKPLFIGPREIAVLYSISKSLARERMIDFLAETQDARRLNISSGTKKPHRRVDCAQFCEWMENKYREAI